MDDSPGPLPNDIRVTTTDDTPVTPTDDIPVTPTDDIPVTPDDIPVVAPPTIKNILFVNSAVISLNAYTNSETMEVGYNNTDTTEDLLHTVLDMSLNRVGFAFHYSYSPFKSSIPVFINQEPFFTDSDLGESVVTYSRNVRFMLDFLLLKRFTHVDFLACDTLLDDKWRLYYQLLQSKTGAVIGASDNNTGSLKYGGDWVMESTHEDVGLIYFTDAIDNWASLLILPTGLNTYYHTFYTVDATDLTKMTRKIYDNTGTLKDTQDISYGGVNISDALAIMEGGGTNPYAVGIEDASLNKISMDVAYYGVYKKPLTETQQALLMTKVNTTYKEPHTYMTTYNVTLSSGFFVCTNISGETMVNPMTLTVGNVYLFDQSDSTNLGTTFKLSSAPYTLTELLDISGRVTANSTPGALNAYTIVSPLSSLSSVYTYKQVNYFVKVVTNIVSNPVFAISTSSSGTYYNQPNVLFPSGRISYKFDVSDPTVTSYVLGFGSVVEVSNNKIFTASGTPGQSGAYVVLDVSAGYSTSIGGGAVYYFGKSTSGMGYYPFVSTLIGIPDNVWYKFKTGDISGTSIQNYVTNNPYSGNTFVDLSFASTPAINSSSIDTTTYKVRNSSLYDISHQYIIFNTATIIPVSSSITMSAWFKYTGVSGVVIPLWFYGNGNSYNSPNSITVEYKNGLNIWYNGNNFSTETTNSVIGANPFLNQAWHHICLVINSTNAYLYYDNVRITSVNSNGIINTTLPYNYRYLCASPWSLGSTDCYQGYVDDFRMYNRAFSTTDVSGLYYYRDTENTYTVTMVGTVVYLNGNSNPELIFQAGNTYIFDQSDSSNASNQIVFSIVANRNPRYSSTDGVTIVGTPGQVGAYTKLVLSSGFTGSLFYCSIVNMVYYYTVSVSGGVYWISTNGATAVTQPMVTFVSGYTYIFDQSHSSNAAKPLGLTLHAGFPTKTTIYSSNLMTSAAYTTGVVTTGTPGTSGSSLQITVDDNTPQPLYYYCTNAGALMGYIPPLALIKYTFEISNGNIVTNSGTEDVSGNGTIEYINTKTGSTIAGTQTCSYDATAYKRGTQSLYNNTYNTSSSYVKLPNVSLQGSKRLTYCFWIKLKDIPAAVSTGTIQAVALSFEPDTTIQNNIRGTDILLYNLTGNNHIYMNYQNSQHYNYFDKTASSEFNNTWQHLTITADLTNNIFRMYTNGITNTSTFVDADARFLAPIYNKRGTFKYQNTANSTLAPSIPTSTKNFRILSGGGTAGTWYLSMKGNIDDYRIYNQILTDDEILSIYNNANYNF